MRFVFITVLIQLLYFEVNAQNALYIPPTITGTTIDLELQTGTVQFFPGNPTNTLGANGAILGPTVVLDKLQDVMLNVTNSLGDETTLHWHGLHVPAMADGGPHNVIQDGTTWNPMFTVLDKAGTFWYHPHLHMHTNEQVLKGIAGMIIVKDDEEAALSLPRSYGVDDFPLIVQTKAFDANNQIVVESADDRHVMVNGTIDPYLDAPAQFVRLRLLNGSSERVFNFGFTNNQSFKLIATDGGLRAAPLDLTRIRLSPGERAEIVVDLTGMEGQSILLRSFASEFENGIYGATNPGMGAPLTATIPGYSANPLNGANFDVLQINVVAPVTVAEPVISLPATLTTITPWEEASANEFRPLILERMTMGGPMNLLDTFVINGQMFDMEVINYYIPLDNIEVWEITNMTPIAHPFHIHDVQFYLLAVNNVAPPAYLEGRKDVVLVPGGQGSVKFITKFEDYADDMMPYMYHCHMLTHEDMGMMGQFIVTENLGIGELDENSVRIYPNPTDESLFLDIKKEVGELNYLITDQSGRTVLNGTVNPDQSVFVGELTNGIYFLMADGYTPVKFIRR
jgi:blue copper oxidase